MRTPFTLFAVVVLLAVACAPLPPVAPAEAPPAVPAPAAATPASAPPAPAASSAAPPKPEPAPPTATFTERGRVSLYGKGDGFAGRKTASGETFDPQALTMAHPTLPFGTRVRVTNLENQRSVEVVVNDRGPSVRGRIADLSVAAAQRIGMVADGVINALLEVVSPAKAR
jgi:rare lipoprotein A